METRICRKCGKEKPIGSFPKRYGKYTRHLRENVCGMCKKRAYGAHHPEKKRLQTWRARARSMHLTLSEYVVWRERRTKRRDRIRVRKNTRTKCPVLSMNPKVDYQVNREYYLAKSRRWSRNNPGKALAKKQRRRFRLAGCLNDLSLEQWEGIKQAFGYRCAYCRRKTKLTMDHVIPISRGGDHVVSNVVPACRRCNSAKHAGPPPRPVQTMLVI
jgi:5-methylcytosine-specific restriction endonuclease McrA